MQITVKFTDVYDGVESVHTDTVEVAPAPVGDETTLREWADEVLFEHTGSGNFDHDHAGYFAEVVACGDQPDLVGETFEWV